MGGLISPVPNTSTVQAFAAAQQTSRELAGQRSHKCHVCAAHACVHVLTGLRCHRWRFFRLSSWSQLCYSCRLGLLQAANKLFVLSLQGLDLLLEGHLDGLHHRSILCDQRGLTQNTGYHGNGRKLSLSLEKTAMVINYFYTDAPKFTGPVQCL